MGEEFKYVFLLTSKKQQITVRLFKLFFNIERLKYKARAVFNDEG